jgi:DNA excision repair protein ERCC-4
VLRIVADVRETSSGIPELLEEKGVYVQKKSLDVADYVVGNFAIERKTLRDFISSLYSGRLFEQAERISHTYSKYLLIVEGDSQEALSELKNPNVYWGTLLALALTFDFKLFFTSDQEQTSNVLYLIAKQTSSHGKNHRPLIVKKPRMATTKDWQLLVLGSLPSIGPKLAEKLLLSFGSVRKVLCASNKELAVRGGIGEVRARKIQQLLDAEYRRGQGKQSKLA